MRRRLLVILMLLVVALVPGSALAQEAGASSDDGDFLLRINGPVTIPAGERVGGVFVIRGDVTVDGAVADTLIVIDGDATLSGTVEKDVIVIGGEIQMVVGSRIDGDLHLYRSDIVRAEGAVVDGKIYERSAFAWSIWDTFVVSVLFWIAMTVLVIVAACFFAAIGGRQLTTASGYVTERIGATVLAALLVGLVIPILAVLAFVSLFGIPVGITLLLVVLPMLAFLGYIVTGTRLGLAILERGRPALATEHPYLAAILGVVLLQAVGLIPFVGALLIFVAAALGAGALTLVAWDAFRKNGVTKPAASPVGEQAPATG